MEPWRKNLREHIKRYGASRLASDLEVGESTISRYTTGARWPPPGMLVRLCEKLGTSADEILGLPPRGTVEVMPPGSASPLVVVQVLAHLDEAVRLLRGGDQGDEVDVATEAEAGVARTNRKMRARRKAG